MNVDIYKFYGMFGDKRQVSASVFLEKIKENNIFYKPEDEQLILIHYKDVSDKEENAHNINIQKLKNEVLGYPEDKGKLFIYGKILHDEYKGPLPWNPPFKEPIQKVACGDQHILVITWSMKLFS